MFTSQVVSHPQSPVSISRLSALIALAAAGLIILILILTAGANLTPSGSATSRPAPSLKFTLSHIKGIDRPVANH
jgi:hypothetical protein